MLNEFKKLSYEQYLAVTSKNNNIIVSAGPGSGKTVVIINRVYDLIKNRGISPKNIIVITFTKAAATNMRKRFLAIDNNIQSPFFGTFHGLCYKILKIHYGEINIIESFEVYNLVKNFLSSYIDDVSEDKVKDYVNAISTYKCKGDYSEGIYNFIDKDILMNCITFYESYKIDKNLLDFEDLQIRCRDLFLKNANILKYYKNQFKHILVDEFQDSDDIQIEILSLLSGDNSIFAVGDEDQCIYSFRGANPIHMIDFKEKFSNGKILYLSTNYRSKSNIVNLSMKSIKNNKFRTDKHIISSKKEDGIIKFQGVSNENIQGNFIGEHILKLKSSSNLSFNNFAVIYRTNIESRSIIDSFIRKGIPFNLLDKQFNFFKHFICQDILSYLKLSIYPYDMDSFIRIINKPYRYISKGNIELVKKSSSIKNPFLKLRSLESIPVFQIKLIEKLENDINSLNRMSVSTAIEFIISDLLYYKYLVEYSEKYHLSIEDLENVLNEFKESASGFKTISEFLNHISEVEDETKRAITRATNNQDGVVLATIHSVKGMEFDTVYMINMVDGFIPYKNNDLEEERRLFYVGLTRAINNIIFIAPDMIRGEKRVKSKFLKECDLSAEIIGGDIYKVGIKVKHNFYGEGVVQSIEDNNITIIFKDKERKFDLAVLINNGIIEVIDKK